MKVLFAAALTMAVAACSSSNPVCDEDVRNRLLTDCKITVSVASGALCLALDGAPEDPATDARLDEHRASTCEIADPDLDAECLKTVSCDRFGTEANICGDPISTARSACFSSCYDTELTCVQECSNSSADFDACLVCEVACASTAKSCAEDCPD